MTPTAELTELIRVAEIVNKDHLIEPDKHLAARIEQARQALSGTDEDQLWAALEDLVFAIPRESEDADWWPDDLGSAVKAAEAAFKAAV